MLTLTETIQDEDCTTKRYTCNEVVELDGSSIWGCTLTEVIVTDVIVNEYEDYKDIAVYYTVDGVDGELVEDSWTMYTDRGFEQGISSLLGYSVGFTEQGMQENGRASMEC